MSIIMGTSTALIGVIIFFTLCCIVCVTECECCGDCGRGEPFDAHNAAKDEVVSNPIEV
jgi:hypothetical protein